MKITLMRLLAGVTIASPLILTSPAAAQSGGLASFSDAQLEAELQLRRRIADACATFRAAGETDLPARCSAPAATAATVPPAGPAPAAAAAQSPNSASPAQETAADQSTANDIGGARNATAQNGQSGTGDRPRLPGQGELAGANDNKQRFGGIEFGIGMAFSLDLGDNQRVREAQLVNGLVRFSRSDDVRARLILESHYFFTPRSVSFFGLTNDGDQPQWGIGPFVAVQPSSDNIIDAIGGGLMIGLRRATEGTDSFNIGIGLLYDIDVQTLGDGILENQPLPAGETEIRFRRRAQSGLMILSSFSF